MTRKHADYVAKKRRRSLFQWIILLVVASFFGALFYQFFPVFLANSANRWFPRSDGSNWEISDGIGTIVPGLVTGWFVATVVMRIVERMGGLWEAADEAERVTTFISILMGFLVATFFVNVLRAFSLNAFVVVGAVIGIGILFAAISGYALHTMKDSLPWYRGKLRARRSGLKVLDTNVIIDGRIYDVAKTGFIEGTLYIPQFVLEELQYIADSHDPLRRQRGKRGLDILKMLQAEFNVEIGIHDKISPEQGDAVDSRLVRLASGLGGDLLTNDHNLNRVATLQDVRVLNLNDLALSLRPNVLPQEHLSLAIIREGNQPGQGIGYLDDGTMVIVENGRAFIGETRLLQVTQVIQTERGKLIFAEVETDDHDPKRRTTTKRI